MGKKAKNRDTAGDNIAVPSSKQKKALGVNMICRWIFGGIAAVGVAFAVQFSRPVKSYSRVLRVPRLDASLPGALEEFFSKYHGRYPVVLDGAIQHWPAMNWTPTTLAALCPNATIPLKAYDTDTHSWAQLKSLGSAPLPKYFATDFGHAKAASKPRYGLEMVVRNECPRLLEDIRMPAFFSEDLLTRFSRMTAWPTLISGPTGTRSALHRDRMNFPFWMALLYGKKRWRIFLFNEPAVDIYEDNQGTFAFDAFEPNLTRFPKLAEATVYEHELLPGELIYIPPGAPHGAINPEDSIATSANYLDIRGLPFHLQSTCPNRKVNSRNSSSLDYSFCKTLLPHFEQQRPAPLDLLKELDYFQFNGHEGPMDWCFSYLEELQYRAQHTQERRAHDIIPKTLDYCKKHGVTELPPKEDYTFEIDIQPSQLNISQVVAYTFEKIGYTYVISSLEHGHLDEWNSKFPDKAVRAGDLIIAFNGKTGQDNFRKAKFERRLSVKILRTRLAFALGIVGDYKFSGVGDSQ